MSQPSPRARRFLLWLGLGLLVAGMLWVSRRVLVPYVVGIIMAYVLLPVVNWLDRRMPRRFRRWRMARVLSILVVYLVLLALLAGILAFAVPQVVGQIKSLIEHWPELASQVEEWGTQGWGWYLENIPEGWREAIEANLKGVGDDALRAVRDGILASLRTVFGTISFIIGLVVVPFWLFYILNDETRVKEGAVRALPQQLRADVVSMARLADDVMSAYLRGQLLLCFFVGSMATVALLILGVPFALVLGLIAGVFEILPVVGPIFGAIPAVVVALLSDPISAVWVAVSFFAIQQVENLILVPRISGKSVRLHPAMVMVVLVIGNEVAGLWGMLLAVPVAAVIRDLFKYLYLRMLDEPLSPEKAMAKVRSQQQVEMGV